MQFHATPEELVALAAELVRETDVGLAIMKFFPFEIRRIDTANVEAALERAPEFRRWGFTLDSPIISVDDELRFSDWNPNHLRLDAGRLTAKGLEQSLLTTQTTDQKALAVWKKAAARLRRQTRSGVVAVNPKSGASAVMKSFRYTDGAKSLADNGVAILPFAGNAILKLGVPE